MSTAATQPCEGASLWQVLKRTVSEWSADRASLLAAAVAYYAIFSIGPLLIISIAVVGMIFGQRAARGQIQPQLTQYFGEGPAKFIQEMVAKAGFSPGLSFAGILSIVLIVYAATNLFAALQQTLNVIFDVKPKPDRGWMALIRDRGMTFLMVALVGLFMLASIVLNTVLATITKGGLRMLGGHSGASAFLLEAVSFLVSAAVFTGVFAMLFKYLPDIKISWRETLIGAVVTAVLFTLGRIGLGYYLSRASVAGPFGAAGSLVIVMLFIYYSAQILFLGAEFTEAWACRQGQKIQPAENAMAAGVKSSRQRKKGEGQRAAARQGSPSKKGAGHWWTGGQGTQRGPAYKIQSSGGRA